MSRSGYSDDGEHIGLWRGAVGQALYGKRGQAFLREMVDALDAMPEKRLLPSVLVCETGCCAMGAVAIKRNADTEEVDAYDRDDVAGLFGIAPAMAAEIAYENDERSGPRYVRDEATDRWVPRPDETPEERWTRMRAWAASHLKKEPTP